MSRKSRGTPSSKARKKRFQRSPVPAAQPESSAATTIAPAPVSAQVAPKEPAPSGRSAKAATIATPLADRRYLMSELRLIGIISGGFVALLLVLALFLR